MVKDIDWNSLTFDYFKTDYNVRCHYKDGKWGDIEIHSEDTINLSIAATCLHYGQEGFEGLKAFRGKDGKIRVFRMHDNALRLQDTCEGIAIPPIPTDKFEEMIRKVVALNVDYIPPYESGASLYIRPIVLGTSPHVGVAGAHDFSFVVFASPVGAYFKGGFMATPYVIVRDYDRAAPLGTGRFKVGGNYAGSLKANRLAHEQGYTSEFYLDSKEKKYIDECGSANFFGIRDNTYITPKSDSILPSITNRSLMQIAEDLGMKVEHRPIPEQELETFSEAGACGTAAVISPISHIDDPKKNKKYVFCPDGKPGPCCEKLYNRLRAIQYGDVEDTHNWTTIIETE